MDENTAAPNTEIQQPAVAAESGEAGAGVPAPAEPVAPPLAETADAHAAANAELAKKLGAAGQPGGMTAEPETAAEPHPGHGVIDEIERLLKVQGAGKWLHAKLDELRNLL